MHKLYEYVCDELKEIEKKAERGDLSMQEVQYADTLAHLKKNLLKADEMMGDENGEYSMAYYPMTSYAEDGGYSRGGYSRDGMSYRGGRSYARGYSRNSSYARGRGSNAQRDSMGRYSSRYSMANDEMIDELHELMNEAQDDRTRQEFEKFIHKIEQM